MTTLSAVITVRDEAAMLPGCLRRLDFADEILVVVDDRTVDTSAAIADEAGAIVVPHHFEGFAGLKNAGLERAGGEWILLVDADERVSRALAAEIRNVLTNQRQAYRIPMANYFYGHLMRWGGWQERPIRLVRNGVGRFSGDIHEVMHLDDPLAPIGTLAVPLTHFSHRSVLDNLRKTATYSDIQARQLLADGAPPVTAKHLYRTVLQEFVYRLVVRQGWRDGMPGVVESLYQPLSLLAVQVRLWELRHDPPIDDSYRKLEDSTW